MPQTSIKRRPSSKEELVDDPKDVSPVERARRRIRQGYYDRPEVRRTLAALILRRAASQHLP